MPGLVLDSVVIVFLWDVQFCFTSHCTISVISTITNITIAETAIKMVVTSVAVEGVMAQATH